MFVIAAGFRSDQHKAEESMIEESVAAVASAHTAQSELHRSLEEAHGKETKEVKEAKGQTSDVKSIGLPVPNIGDVIKQAQSIAQASIDSIKAILIGAYKGKSCPTKFPSIPDGYEYGVGCGLTEIGCTCPSFLDVCATSPRMGKAEDFENMIVRLSVQQLGYCRTGAWVFILSAVLVLVALGGIGYFVYKKR
eukprot:Skav216492  [mRNA]  locus=scaffold1123:506519:507097:- [translate_table: standard]